ncbi:MAG: hypothetical protein JST12_13235 [Armatimonadetes bacterium]|nr:hypothetical protein [Armatimonadota bacterium]MBS1702623.1 hypothetical protein [Armatimonadota bacterium]MBS1726053.1 hypothetical protein [Armatimonadota bacterium]
MKATGIPKHIVYLLLIVCATVPLFFNIKVPGKPTDSSADFFKHIMSLNEGDTILLGSDWTGSTRGESKAQMIAVLKILMRKHVKIALWSTADPQAPRVAQDTIAEVNEMIKKEGGTPYVRWQDWVQCGFYPSSDVAINNVANDVRKAFAGKRDTDTSGQLRPVFESPVLQNITKVEDFKLVLDMTASKTSDYHVQFVSGKHVPLMFAVTGVMVPETQVYYNSGQIAGFLGGLKGVFDLESMMDNGLNVPDANGKIANPSVKVSDKIEGFPDPQHTGKNVGNGTKYYPTLHATLILMIVLIVIGNFEMIKARKVAGK